MVIDDTGSVEDIHAFIYCKKRFGQVLLVHLCIVESATWSLPVNQPLDRAVTPEQREVKILEIAFALS